MDDKEKKNWTYQGSQSFTVTLGVQAQNSHKDTEAFQLLLLSLKEWLGEGAVCRSTF